MAIVKKCDMCGGSDSKLLFSSDEDHHVGIVKCKQCGVVYRNIIEDDQKRYKSYDNVVSGEPSDLWKQERLNSVLPYVRILEKYRKLNRVLDIGCGHGFFLEQCKRDDWDCKGLEVSKPAAKYAKEHFELDVDSCTIKQANFSPSSFDVILLWNVLDEVESPSALIQEVYNLLRPGGIVLIRVRNACFHIPAYSIIQKLSCFFKNISKWDSSVIHLFSFAPRHLKNLANIAGFKQCRVSNAILSWTRMYDDRKSRSILKSIFLFLFQSLCSIIYIISFKKILISPSLFCYMVKKGQLPE